MNTIRNFDLKEKKVIIRCDFNVPIKDGQIIDDNRIKESLQTIRYALNQGAIVILMSHLGRVASEEDKKKYTLAPVALRLAELLQQEVIFISSAMGNKEIINKMKPGEVALIENTRHQDYPVELESRNNQELARNWASLADLFINDAFGSSHRSHASTVGIARLLPSGIGFLVEKELMMLKKIENPEKPLIIILGGAKVKDKIGLIENLLHKADYILVGGGIANTFVKAKGAEVGNSLIDETSISFCQKVLKVNYEKIITPIDFRVAKTIDDKGINVDYDKVEAEMSIYDIGPKTVDLFNSYLEKARTVVWNGTLGLSEYENFKEGTYQIAKKLSELNITVVIGGGDTAGAVIEMGFKDAFTHISTGGGAAIEILEGRDLVGITVIAECE